uniref:SH3 domain-containing protein n=1 Tax=Eptatretus burgeri TaxID=7764 RepID=A0A8C4Q959_EPTBU
MTDGTRQLNNHRELEIVHEDDQGQACVGGYWDDGSIDGQHDLSHTLWKSGEDGAMEANSTQQYAVSKEQPFKNCKVTPDVLFLTKQNEELQQQLHERENICDILRQENTRLKATSADIKEKVKLLKRRQVELVVVARNLEDRARKLQETNEHLAKVPSQLKVHLLEKYRTSFAQQHALELGNHAAALLARDVEAERLRDEIRVLREWLGNEQDNVAVIESRNTENLLKESQKEVLCLQKQLSLSLLGWNQVNGMQPDKRKKVVVPGKLTAKRLKQLEEINNSLRGELKKAQKEAHQARCLENELRKKRKECETLEQEVKKRKRRCNELLKAEDRRQNNDIVMTLETKVLELEQFCQHQSEQFNRLSRQMEILRQHPGQVCCVRSSACSVGPPKAGSSTISPWKDSLSNPLSCTLNSACRLEMCEVDTISEVEDLEMDSVSPSSSIGPQKDRKLRVFIARFSYNPFDGPNENPEAELPLVAGDYVYVRGGVDDDSFYEGFPEPPVDVRVEAGPLPGTLLLSWLPVTLDTCGSSNGASVYGYAVFVDGKKVLEVSCPTAGAAILERVACGQAVMLTLRTLSQHGTSVDSFPARLLEALPQTGCAPTPAALIGQDHEQQECNSDFSTASFTGGLLRDCPPLGKVAQVKLSHEVLESAESSQSPPGDFGAESGQCTNGLHMLEERGSWHTGSRCSLEAIPACGEMHLAEGNHGSELSDILEEDEEEAISETDGSKTDSDEESMETMLELPLQTHCRKQLFSIPEVAEEEEEENNVEYRDATQGSCEPTNVRIRQLNDSQSSSDLQMKMNNDVEGPLYPVSTTLVEMVGRLPQDQGSGQVDLECGNEPKRVFVALFDYDPVTMSPNADAVDKELPFVEGQIIKVFGHKDRDGFYRGETSGRCGLFPSNMLSELHTDSEDLLEEILQQGFLHPSIPMTNHDRCAGAFPVPGFVFSISSTHLFLFCLCFFKLGFLVCVHVTESQPISAKRMVALFDYNPRENSPNMDAEVS